MTFVLALTLLCNLSVGYNFTDNISHVGDYNLNGAYAWSFVWFETEKIRRIPDNILIIFPSTTYQAPLTNSMDTEGIEPPTSGLEPDIIPFNYASLQFQDKKPLKTFINCCLLKLIW